MIRRETSDNSDRVKNDLEGMEECSVCKYRYHASELDRELIRSRRMIPLCGNCERPPEHKETRRKRIEDRIRDRSIHNGRI